MTLPKKYVVLPAAQPPRFAALPPKQEATTIAVRLTKSALTPEVVLRSVLIAVFKATVAQKIGYAGMVVVVLQMEVIT